MPNLIEELGPDYITQMYSGAFFLHNGTPHYLERARNNVVTCQKMQDNRWIPVALSYDDFKDMSKFSWPSMGYRNVPYKKHNMVVDVGLLRSTKRGLRGNLLTAEHTKAGALFASYHTPTQLLGDGARMAEILLLPKYYTLQQAQEALYDGQAVSCAISSSLALEINPFVEDPKELSVLYRGAKIGAMHGDGTLAIPSRIAMRLAR